jgi:predicted transcriptional regulator
MSGRATAEISAKRRREVWRMHDRGMTQRAISRKIGISLSSVQHFLKGRPTNDPLPRPGSGSGSGSAAATIIPGSLRTERTERASELMTIRCDCGHEQEVHTFNHTSTCRGCGRKCRFGPAELAGPNVVELKARRA